MKRKQETAGRPTPASAKRTIAIALSPLAAMLLAAYPMQAGAADTFTGLGDLIGVPSFMYSKAFGVSADGTVAVGASGQGDSPGTHAFRWTSAGMTDLGTLGGTSSTAYAISSNGSVIVGDSNKTGDAVTHAFRWTSAGGMADLGTLGGNNSTAYAASSDGSVVVGKSQFLTGVATYRAFRWTSGGGMVDLGTLGGDTYSYAYGVSADGSVVVGNAETAAARSHAFRWTSAGGMADLGTLGGSNSYAYGVSSDGSVVVGYSDITGNATTHAFRWTSSVMTDLGLLSGGTFSQANAVSGDGKVVVGMADDNLGNNTAFRWTQSTGMQSVVQWLSASGVTVTSGWTLDDARATNSDGSVVVGYGTDNHGKTQAWLARVSPQGSGLGSGLIIPSDFNTTLASAGAISQVGGDLASLILFGAHHRPLMDSSLPAGMGCAWATADASHHDSTGTDQQVAEAGACRDVAGGSWRLGAGVGVSYAKQALAYGGDGKYDGRYFYAEADYAPDATRWIASFATLYSTWNTTVTRGYLNAGSTDRSVGTPDAGVWSVRARFDWKNRARLGQFGLSPYAAYTHTENRLDGYTETGGGFPARFDAQHWRTDELRLGAVAQRNLSAVTSLRFDLEAVSRLDGAAPAVSGQVLGLYSFAFSGASASNNWVRAGAEVDHRLADKSLLNASLNVASTGQDPTWNVSVGYRRSF